MKLNLRSKLKKGICLLFFSLLSSPGVRCEIINALSITLDDGSEEIIPLYNDATLTPNDNNLQIKFYSGEIEIPLINISKFKKCEIEMDLPSNDDPSQNDGIYDVNQTNNSEWVIFSIDGVEIARGKGIIDYTPLKNGKIYIIKQGSIQYKLIMK